MSENPDELVEGHPWWQPYKIPLIFGLVGILFVIFGLRLLMSPSQSEKVEFVENSTQSPNLSQIKADIAGGIEKPGLYSLSPDSRLQDLLVAAGGLSAMADREWVSKHMNLAAKLIDGTKIYVPLVGENGILGAASGTSQSTLININTATTAALDTLPGVGEVTAQKIISNRPYQETSELVIKKAVNQSTFEKIKDLITTN